MPRREADPSGIAEVEIEVVEPMGAETYLYLNTGATPFVARVRATRRFDAEPPAEGRLRRRKGPSVRRRHRAGVEIAGGKGRGSRRYPSGPARSRQQLPNPSVGR